MYVTTCDHGAKRNFDILKPYIFETRNGIGNLPKEWVDVSQKDPNLFVYNSSVTKGMIPLVTKIWPEVLKHIPQAKLKVIGGYYKFREGSAPDKQEQDWHRLVQEHPEVEFTGIITQTEISNILRKASYMVYPAAFPETYGISTLEALAHNVPLITCRFGALEETAIEQACYKMRYTVERNWSCPWLDEEVQIKSFTAMVIDVYRNKYLHQQKMYACNRVKDICGWDSVALQWKQHLYRKLGEYLSINDYRKVQKINTKVRKTFGRRFLNKEEVTEPRQAPYNPIAIVTPVYNAEKYIERCIASVAQQDYDNYTMYIINDKSTDDTGSVARKYIDNLSAEVKDKIILVNNAENKGAVCNHVSTIMSMVDLNSIVMLLDGDDWLVNDPNLFHKYNNIYNEGAEFTYGSCWSIIDNIPLIAQEYPPNIKQTKQYKKYKFNWNMPYTHLRTFRAELMHRFVSENGYKPFKDENDNWLKAGGDTSVFYAMIETADPNNVVCIPEVVYNYNDANPINDYKVNSDEQTRNANRVLGIKVEEIKSPFEPGQYDLRPL
jgi:glycosyltransferase involved in cell wall biosynthesis